jgi:hypothetical protein
MAESNHLLSLIRSEITVGESTRGDLIEAILNTSPAIFVSGDVTKFRLDHQRGIFIPNTDEDKDYMMIDSTPPTLYEEETWSVSVYSANGEIEYQMAGVNIKDVADHLIESYPSHYMLYNPMEITLENREHLMRVGILN